jgi:hypothetical protein
MVPDRSAFHVHVIDKLTVCHPYRIETGNPGSKSQLVFQITVYTDIEKVSESFKSSTPESLRVSCHQPPRQ